jgi:hypothetical protein
MKCRLLLILAVSATVAIPAAAQSVDNNPGHQPTADLDNHRPLISKKEKAPTSRTVSGRVVDEISGAPIKGAMVTLTDLSTHEQRQSITKEDGRYIFDDLSFTIDYELKARYKEAVTDVRKLSQYDHTAKVIRILTIPDSSAPSTANEAKKQPDVKN